MELMATALDIKTASIVFDEIKDEAQKQDPVWCALIEEWERQPSLGFGSDIHGTREVEFHRLRCIEDQTGLPFQLFQERFVRSLRNCGFPSEFAYALAGTLAEMSDNVVQHSREGGEEFTGLVGYHVSAAYMAFAVIDIGCGLLTSLKRSPAWQHLASARDALRAVVRDGASSRTGQGRGEGFRLLFRSLASRNCRIRLRTNNASMTIADTTTRCIGSEVPSPELSGFQMSVCCALDGQPVEEKAITCI